MIYSALTIPFCIRAKFHSRDAQGSPQVGNKPACDNKVVRKFGIEPVTRMSAPHPALGRIAAENCALFCRELSCHDDWKVTTMT